MNNLTLQGQCIPHGNIDMLLTVASFLPFFYPQKEKKFISAHSCVRIIDVDFL